MPPANSPTEITTPPTLEPSTPFFEQLAEITSPVPDLASTLLTQAEQEINESNLRFLRSRPPTPPQRHGHRISPPGHSVPVRIMPSSSDSPSYPWAQADSDARDSRRRARRQGDASADARRQIPSWDNSWADQHHGGTDTYGGWAPGTAEDARASQGLRRSDMSSAQLYNQWSSRMREMRSNRSGESQGDRRQELLRTAREISRFHEQLEAPTISESAVRSTTRMLAPRQEPPPHHSTQYLERYIWDRERGSGERPEDHREEDLLPSQSQHESSRARQRMFYAIEANRQRVRQNENEGQIGPPLIRQHYLEDPTAAAPENKSVNFEVLITRITRLCRDEAFDCERERKELLDPIHHTLQVEPDDRISDYLSLPPPPTSSWLHSSDAFSGAQQAAPPVCSRHRSERSAARSNLRPPHPGRRAQVQQINPNYRPRDTPPVETITRSPSPGSDKPPQRWPVRVRIEHVDYETMTLSGTMEAFNSTGDFPPLPGSTPTTPSLDDYAPPSSSVKSFMQGEIIDFRTHTLESTNFHDAKPRIDANNWRRLGPWKTMSDAEVAKSVCSRKWIENELWGAWILMRWKEKHFITTPSPTSTLTISGFYYVALDRRNGHIEALYYDPKCSPYQRLNLQPERNGVGVFGQWEFT